MVGDWPGPGAELENMMTADLAVEASTSPPFTCLVGGIGERLMTIGGRGNEWSTTMRRLDTRRGRLP